MLVDYENNDLKRLFDDLNDIADSKGLMKRRIGAELARCVKKRYNQIVSFSSFFELQQSHIGKLEPLEGDFEGMYSLRLDANIRLIVKPLADGRSAEELKRCDTLIIEGVIDYHGTGKKYNRIIP